MHAQLNYGKWIIGVNFNTYSTNKDDNIRKRKVQVFGQTKRRNVNKINIEYMKFLCLECYAHNFNSVSV